MNFLNLCLQNLFSYPLFFDEMKPFFIEQRKFIAAVIRMRNLIVHNGRVVDAVCWEYLEDLVPNFESAIKGLHFFTKATLVGVERLGTYFSLMGYLKPSEYYPTANLHASLVNNQDSGKVFLIHLSSNEVLELFPMSAFAEIFQWDDKGGQGTGIISLMLYLRKGHKQYIDYTTFVDKPQHSQDFKLPYKKFQEIFRLEEWRLADSENTIQDKYLFSELRYQLLECFVGREAEVDKILEWINNQSEGILWIDGKPGIGKSALIAKVHQVILNATHETDMVLIPYYFRASNQNLCNRQSFLQAAISTLTKALGFASHTFREDEKVESYFLKLLEVYSRKSADRGNGKILFLLDSMDEIYNLDKQFPLLVTGSVYTNVIWVCTGRDDQELLNIFTKDKCDWLFPNVSGLQPLRLNEIRSILIDECDRAAFGLLHRDVLMNDGQWSNPFLDKLIRNSEGLPLYVRLLVEDIREGKYDFTDEKKLPIGLNLYYEEILDRLGVSDAKFLMTPLLSLLALACEPITLGIFITIFKPLSLGAQTEELIKESLAQGHIMLKKTLTRAGVPRFSLYHESFRQYILFSEKTRKMVEIMRGWLSEFCYSFDQTEMDDENILYALRYGVQHLIEAGKWSEAVIMLDKLYKSEELKARLPKGQLYDFLEKLAISLSRCQDTEAAKVNPFLLASLLTKLEDLEPLYNAVKFLHVNSGASWKDILPELINAGCWVLNYSISRLLADICLQDNQQQQYEEIISMTDDVNVDIRETALLTLKLLYALNPKKIDPSFLQRHLSDSFISGGVAGELILILALNGVPISHLIKGSSFERPIWDYNKGLLVDIIAGEYFRQHDLSETIELEGIFLDGYQQFNEIEQLRINLLNEPLILQDPSLTELISKYYQLPLDLGLLRLAEASLRRSPLLKQLLRLFFASPYWEVREQASYVFNSIAKTNVEYIGIISEFLDDENWHIRYTALEAAADVWVLDNYTIFIEATRKCFNDRNSWVRGLCAENIVWYIFADFDNRLELISFFNNEIKFLLKDDDIWVLDKLHALFYKMFESGENVEEILKVLTTDSCLLSQNSGWFQQDRSSFLSSLESIQRNFIDSI